MKPEEREARERVVDRRGPTNARGWRRVVRYRWDCEWERWWKQYSWREKDPQHEQQLGLFDKEAV